MLEVVVRWGERDDSVAIHYDDCWALRRGHPHLVEATEQSVCCPHLGAARPASTLCLPILVRGDVQGLLTLGAAQPLGPAASQLAQAAANQLELTLAKLQLQESQLAQAVRDPLTDLFNCRALRRQARGPQSGGSCRSNRGGLARRLRRAAANRGLPLWEVAADLSCLPVRHLNSIGQQVGRHAEGRAVRLHHDHQPG
jgi:hypothetical protein